MTTRANIGVIAANHASAAKQEGPALRAALVLVALIVGLSSWLAYTQLSAAQFAPSLARKLTQASQVHSETGDREAALATSRRAVDVYRRLMHMSAVHYAPHLATSLHNLALRLIENGDNAGARTAIEEALRIRAHLARSDPARYRLKLAESNELLAQIEAPSGTAPHLIVTNPRM
jgi:Tetratricopeptide repeat